jgi:crossover junction endodeoxyribonuclease RuvC
VDAGIVLQHSKAPTRLDYFTKMREIKLFFAQMIQDHNISVIGMEKLYFTSSNQANAEFVYGVRAMIWLLALDHNIPVYERTPNEIKKFITGNGKAEKQLVEQFIMKLFRLSNIPQYHDTSDALGIAYLARNKSKAQIINHK